MGGPHCGKGKPKVFVVHGEPTACQTLAAEIKKRYGLDVFAPRAGKYWSLTYAKAQSKSSPTPIPEDPRQTMLRVATELEREIATLRSNSQQANGSFPR